MPDPTDDPTSDDSTGSATTAPSSGPNGSTTGDDSPTEVGRRHRRRPSRFDRPREPHDWRWAVGTVGRVLIATGLLMFAFVSYQLWGTGIRTAQAQNRLENEFEDLLATATTISVPAATSVPPTTTPPTSPGDSIPDTTAPATVPPSTEPPVTTLPPAVISAPEEGEPLARIEIPSIEVDWIVIEGVGASSLQDGPGHFPETPLPGQVGNSAIAGHRTTHGQPFFRVDEIQPGDEIIVTTLAGRYVYVMTAQVLVAPSEYGRVIPAVDPSKATITLVSCHPKYSTRQRIIITGELDLERSDLLTAASPLPTDEPSELPDEPVDSGPANDDPANDDPATGDPGATSPEGSDPVDSAPADTVPTTDPGPDTDDTSPVGDPGDGSGDGSGDDQEGQTLFENGWFSDPAAFPHVGGWGVLLSVIGIGAYLLSRRARRNWVGLLVGFAPFVVVLYFWFENVNRLLPPNL